MTTVCWLMLFVSCLRKFYLIQSSSFSFGSFSFWLWRLNSNSSETDFCLWWEVKKSRLLFFPKNGNPVHLASLLEETCINNKLMYNKNIHSFVMDFKPSVSSFLFIFSLLHQWVSSLTKIRCLVNLWVCSWTPLCWFVSLSLHEFCTVAVITYVDLMSSGLALLILILLILIVYRFFLSFLDVQSYGLQVIVFFLSFQSYSSSPFPSVPLSSVPFHFPCIVVLFMTSSTMLNRRGQSGWSSFCNLFRKVFNISPFYMMSRVGYLFERCPFILKRLNSVPIC